MGKVELVFLVGSGMWMAYCMAVYVLNIDISHGIAYELGRLFTAIVISVPLFIASYLRFNQKRNLKEKTVIS